MTLESPKKILAASGAIRRGHFALLATKGLFEIDLGVETSVLVTLDGMDAVRPDGCPAGVAGVSLT